MTRFRKWLLTAGITLALLLPLASVASADPFDPGTSFSTSTSSSSIQRGHRPTTTASDPFDPGTGP